MHLSIGRICPGGHVAYIIYVRAPLPASGRQIFQGCTSMDSMDSIHAYFHVLDTSGVSPDCYPANDHRVISGIPAHGSPMTSSAIV